MLAGAVDLLEVPDGVLEAAFLHLLLQQLAVEQDGVHGGAQLVAHVGQEDALGAAGLLRLVFGLGQVLVGLHQLGRALLDTGLQAGVQGPDLRQPGEDGLPHGVEGVHHLVQFVRGSPVVRGTVQPQGRAQVVQVHLQGVARHGGQVAGHHPGEQQHQEDRGEEGHQELAAENGQALGPESVEHAVQAGDDLQGAHGPVAVVQGELPHDRPPEVRVRARDEAVAGVRGDLQERDVRELEDALELGVELVRVVVPEAGFEAAQEAGPDLLHPGLDGGHLAAVVHEGLHGGRQYHQRRAEQEDGDDEALGQPGARGPSGRAGRGGAEFGPGRGHGGPVKGGVLGAVGFDSAGRGSPGKYR